MTVNRIKYTTKKYQSLLKELFIIVKGGHY